MVFYIWPIAPVAAANVAYQVCAKSAPEAINPPAALASRRKASASRTVWAR